MAGKIGKIKVYPEELNEMSFEERKVHKEKPLRQLIAYI